MKIDKQLAIVASAQFGLDDAAVGAYDCHVYACRTSEGVVLVDSGGGLTVDRILMRLGEYWPGAELKAVVLTHAHGDHSCGAELLRRRTGCAVYAPSTSIEVIRSGDETAIGLRDTYPPAIELHACPDAIAYEDGVKFEVAGVEFEPIHVRGHSADAHCLLASIAGRRTLFAGDVLFYGAVFGVIARPDSGMWGYKQDLHKLEGRKVEAFLPGHGLFTMTRGQHHIDRAIDALRQGFLPRQIGQFDLVF